MPHSLSRVAFGVLSPMFPDGLQKSSKKKPETSGDEPTSLNTYEFTNQS